ncbi:hypothetical protein [Azospirillum argentinense]
MTGTIIRGPFRTRLRMVRPQPPAARLRGAIADLRECIREATVNRDDLREIAHRLDSLADDMEGHA